MIATSETATTTKSVKFPRQAKWRSAHPLARWAHVALSSGLKKGLLERKPCEVCGEPDSEGHHDDYQQPLRVRWLCRQHHRATHARQRKAKKGGAA